MTFNNNVISAIFGALNSVDWLKLAMSDFTTLYREIIALCVLALGKILKQLDVSTFYSLGSVNGNIDTFLGWFHRLCNTCVGGIDRCW